MLFLAPTIWGDFIVELTNNNEVLELNFPNQRISQRIKEKNEKLGDELNRYFTGKSKKINLEYSVEKIKSGFDSKVLNEVLKIRYGEITTYSDISKKLYNSVKWTRAVGNALKRNPLPIIIPCHRIIRNDSFISGFSGGIIWKKRLIELERGKKCIISRKGHYYLLS
ncbi:MAG: methylated-DNA--[protein]-cysteine S-methyltransferase [Candidatus Hydrogenedentota bacterium]